ncbi:MAG: ABC transporter permease subunit [Bacilli bacterium]|nr:ABC transporter permease subunit [Bacilli bacterium]
MNIIKRELRSNLKSFIIWSVSISLLVFVYTTEFGIFADSPDILDAMAQFEDIFRYLNIYVIDMTTPEGFTSMVSLYFYLGLGIYSALLGSSIISKEERDKTAEYLFTLPIKRNQVIVSKMFTAIFYSLMLNLIAMSLVILLMLPYDPSRLFFTFMRLLIPGVFFFQLIFLSIGMLLSSMLKQYKKSGSITIGLLIGSYLLSTIIGLIPELDFLKYIIPYEYFEAAVLLENGAFNIVYLIITISLIILSLSGTFIFYKKRDLYL